jgi:hypothetical protein
MRWRSHHADLQGGPKPLLQSYYWSTIEIMPVARRSISISFELDESLEVIAIHKQLPKSKVIEMLLREHPLVRKQVELGRLEENISVFAVSSRHHLPRAKRVKARQQA